VELLDGAGCAGAVVPELLGAAAAEEVLEVADSEGAAEQGDESAAAVLCFCEVMQISDGTMEPLP